MKNILNIQLLDFIRDQYVIGIDSGHGWLTGGKRSIDGSLRENEPNTAIEDKLCFLLDSLGFEYYQTAPGWKDNGLAKRKIIENKLFSDTKARGKSFLGISIHADAYPDTSAEGFCTYYYQKGIKESVRGRAFARCMSDSIIESDKKNHHIIKPRHNNGIKGKNFFMLRETSGTWILIENAFMTNERDLKFLNDDKFRNDRAYAMLQGILQFIKIET